VGGSARPQPLDRGVLRGGAARRIGLAIVPMLYDVDAAVREVVWAHEHGLQGILIPALTGDHAPYNHPKYYPVWRECEERGMVVHNHSGPAPDYDFSLPGAMGVFLVEFAWWAARPMWHLIFGGVFELFPKLKYCLTEVSEFWVPSHARAHGRARVGEAHQRQARRLPLEPHDEAQRVLPAQLLAQRVGAVRRRQHGRAPRHRHEPHHVGHGLPAPRGQLAATRARR
jgi:predicted TIM-barrel fold metal-dependent hydrolase